MNTCFCEFVECGQCEKKIVWEDETTSFKKVQIQCGQLCETEFKEASV